MTQCTKCSTLRSTWSMANSKFLEARIEHGSGANETLIAAEAEAGARKKWVAHSVGCKEAHTELLELLPTEREKRMGLSRSISSR